MINLNKLEAELKKITGHIVSVSAKVSEKWSPSGFADVFIDADGDRVGVCYTKEITSQIKEQINIAILGHSKEDTDEQKLQRFGKIIPGESISALLCAVSCLGKNEKIPVWAMNVINTEAAKLPVIEDKL